MPDNKMNGGDKAMLIFGCILIWTVLAGITVWACTYKEIEQSKSHAFQQCVTIHSPAECKLAKP